MMLDRIAGNEALKDSLRTMLRQEHLPHSVLLVGEPGTGTGFAARCTAADFLYPQGDPAAETVLKSANAEVLEIRPGGKMNLIAVETVRNMRKEIFNTALSAKGRVVILYGAERLNEASANAILKVMEEPPENVLFLLTASGLAGVLPTIRSRCIALTVAPLPLALCEKLAIQQGVDPAGAQLLSAAFDGRLGSVLAAAGDAESRKRLEDARSLCKAAAEGNAYAAQLLLTPYEKDRQTAQALLRDLCSLALAGLQLPRLTGLTTQQTARVVEAARQALTALAGNGTGKLVLTLLAARMTAEN